MIVDYQKKYEDDIKDLLVELQKYIITIDKMNYNRITSEYRDIYFQKTMEEIKKCNGKMYLYEQNQKIVGLIIGIIHNEAYEDIDFKVPKRGRITELVVSNSCRGQGIGKQLLNKMTEHLKQEGCEDILIGVFGYNESAIRFYQKNGYHIRMLDMISKIGTM